MGNPFGPKIRKKSKYGNAMAGGSKLEESLNAWLELRQKKGEISELKRQQTVELLPESGIRWRLDFSYMEKGKLTFAEAKGFETEDYKLKLKIWKWRSHRSRPFDCPLVSLGPLEIFKGRHDNFQLAERIE